MIATTRGSNQVSNRKVLLTHAHSLAARTGRTIRSCAPNLNSPLFENIQVLRKFEVGIENSYMQCTMTPPGGGGSFCPKTIVFLLAKEHERPHCKIMPRRKQTSHNLGCAYLHVEGICLRATQYF